MSINTYRASAAYTITLASLASSSGLTVGRCSTSKSNATNKDEILAVSGQITVGTTTTAGVIRLYLYDGTNNYLLREILVTAVTPSTSLEAWSADVDLDGLILPSGWKLRASTHNAEAFRIFARGGDF